GNDTYTFSFPPSSYGLVNATWSSSHGIADLASPANAFNAAAPGNVWQYDLRDNVAPSLVSITPPPTVTVRTLREIEVTFSESVVGVDAADLLINTLAATNVVVTDASHYRFQFSQPPDGPVQVTWRDGHNIKD